MFRIIKLHTELREVSALGNLKTSEFRDDKKKFEKKKIREN